MATSREQQEYEISRRIEGFILAWLEVQDKQGQLDQFQESHQPPEPPGEFDSVSSLIDFLQKKESYERDLVGFNGRLQAATRAFAGHEGPFLEVLPEGVPLVYEYQTYGSGPVGKRFRITKVPSDGGHRIEIVELDA